jgi:hypothetical protein
VTTHACRASWDDLVDTDICARAGSRTSLSDQFLRLMVDEIIASGLVKVRAALRSAKAFEDDHAKVNEFLYCRVDRILSFAHPLAADHPQSVEFASYIIARRARSLAMTSSATRHRKRSVLPA